MKNIHGASIGFIAALLLVSAPAFAKSLDLDPGASHLRWTGKKVTGQHTGTVALKSGKIDIDGRKLKGGKFEIDMTSIADEDLKDADYNKKLVGHLKSDDFFGVEKHPVATFEIKTIK